METISEKIHALLQEIQHLCKHCQTRPPANIVKSDHYQQWIAPD